VFNRQPREMRRADLGEKGFAASCRQGMVCVRTLRVCALPHIRQQELRHLARCAISFSSEGSYSKD